MITNTIGQLTELQANGGGYFTESYPTNSHHFYKRKVLVGKETAAMFKDVTAADKTTIEQQDAEWTEPSASLIERAEACGVVYNRKTGFFEHNGIVDLTTAEVTDMLTHVNEIFLPGGRRLQNLRARTNIVTASTYNKGWNADFVNLDGVCGRNQYIEVLKIGDCQVGRESVLTCFGHECRKLRKVIGELDIFNVSGIRDAFVSASCLEEITLYGLKVSISFADCPLLSLASLQYLVTNAANTSAITVTVHPEVYAKLTDEGNAAWNAVLTSAEAKQITFATT